MTADVVPFPEKKRAPNPAHANCVRMVEGRPWYLFAVSFRVGLPLFEFHIWATDAEDAERRTAAIKQTATLTGQVLSTS